MKLLILGGGGTLGAFSAGALEVVLEAAWRPDTWIGSSAGAINLLRCFAAGPSAPANFWRSIGPKTLLGHLLSHDPRRGLLDAARFRASVDEGVDYDRLFHDQRTFGFMVVDLQTGRVRIRSNRTESSPEALRAVAHAAFAVPPLLPPVAWAGELLADGGLLHNAPLSAAVDLGATEIIYLNNVHALPHPNFAGNSILRATARYADVFFRRASNVGFADAEIVEDRFRGIPFLTIAPPATLRFGSMMRWMLPTVNAMAHPVERGRVSACRALDASTFCKRLQRDDSAIAG